jgi:hypothetical protein
MRYLFVIATILILLALIKPLMRILFLLFLRKALRGGLADVGRQAMAEQPDQIHLTSEPGHAWADGAAVEALAAPLASLGFQEAGVYGIQEMAGVVVRFLVQPGECVIACIYEHPQVGTWIDLAARYVDGRSITCTTARATGLDPKPGAQTIRAPGASSEELYQRLLRERPAGDLEEVTLANVVDRFQDAYARETAWRKNKGISVEEVAREIQLMPVEACASSD